MNKGKNLDFITLFRLPSYLLVTSVAGIVLSSLGFGMLAVGLLIGVLLYVTNLFFLYEGGKSLLNGASSHSVKTNAALSSIGRMFFLAVALGFVLRIGPTSFFAACGGLLAGQVNLHLVLLIEGRIGRRCSGL